MQLPARLFVVTTLSVLTNNTLAQELREATEDSAKLIIENRQQQFYSDSTESAVISHERIMTNTTSAAGDTLVISNAAAQTPTALDAPAGVAATTAKWKVMPLGDSITRGHASAGSSPEGGYRDDLASLLSAEGIAYDFVGSQATGSGFDRNHEGHSGKTADYIDANVVGWLQARKPQVVLLHIGTNDISQNESPASTASEISSILDKIRNHDPQIRTVVCSTIPRKDSRNPQNDDLVKRIEEVYYEKRAAGHRVFYAGQNEIYLNNSSYKTAYLYDSVHPNNEGYHLLAEVYLNHLLTALTFEEANITDNFNRKNLGKTWVADAEYAINDAHLQNSATNVNWNYLAVYAAQTNPGSVSIKWSEAADATGIAQGGLALRLSKPATDAFGYFATIGSDATLQLWAIENGVRTSLMQSSSSAIAPPLPGNVFRVALSSDANGHHFDYYLDEQFGGRLSDAAKQYGNGGRLFAGVMLRGNANNAVDDWVLSRGVTLASPTLTLTAPNGGENWQVGSVRTITWASQGVVGDVKLEYSIDNGGSWSTIVAGVTNDGSQDWTIPTVPSSSCLVRISEAVDDNPSDISNAVFTIAPVGVSVNYALNFDGLSDYVEIPDNALLSGGAGKSITVETWVKPDVVSGTRPLVQKFLDGGTKDWGMQIADGTIEVGIESNADNWLMTGGNVSAGGWTHIAFSFDNPSNVAKLFVNGIEIGQQSLTKDMPDSRAVIRFARHGYATQYLDGEIDEVRIWNYARSAGEVAANMNLQLNGNESGLIGYWNFNEGSGQSAGDASGNGNPARLGSASSSDSGDPQWVVSTVPQGSATPALQITSPNGGESWQVGSSQTITWSAQGTVADVKLEYSTDNGSSWATIANSTANDGNYGWTIPNAVSNQCLVRISEAEDGDPSDVSNGVFAIVSSGGGSTSLSFQPIQDAYVKSSTPASTFGTTATLRARKSSSETMTSYLKFEVSGVSGPVQRATLRLYVTDASSDGGAVYSVSNKYEGTTTSWIESGLNWNNAPAISGTALSSVSSAAAGVWVEFEVTPAITGDGMYSFGLKNSASDAVYYGAKESTDKPQLVIQIGSGATAARSIADSDVDGASQPAGFALRPNYPNPFNAQTVIEYFLPESAPVRLTIYNALGQRVLTLVEAEQADGEHRALWDGKDEQGASVGAGIYFYELEAGPSRLSGKMMLQQ